MAQEFITACLIMGLGIGIDVAIATFVRASAMTNKHTVIKWVVGVSATHTLFPMIGYLLTYFSLQVMPIITPVVGVLAFILISVFLFDELKGGGESDSHNNQGYISFALVLAVSWDALWSGPAKSAQVVQWSDWMIWGSFILVGIVVMIISLASLYLERKICRTKLTKFPWFLDVSRWVQYSVINYFGMLALVRYTFSSNINWLYIMLVSFTLIYILLKFLRVKYNYVNENNYINKVNDSSTTIISEYK